MQVSALDVGCGYCFAGRGEPCRSPRGVAVPAHSKRKKAFNKAKPHLLAQHWNSSYQVGVRVGFYPGFRPRSTGDIGRSFRRVDSETTSRAWVLGGHTPVVLVEGYSGAIALSHIDVLATGSEGTEA